MEGTQAMDGLGDNNERKNLPRFQLLSDDSKNKEKRWIEADPSYLGRVGCDSPLLLLEKNLELFVRQNKKEPVDFMILNGDLLAHGCSVEP